MFDVEAALVAWLPEKTGVPWYADVPEPRPARFGTVERTGGGRSGVVVDSPMVALQAWGETRADAKRLAYDAADALPSFARERGVRKVEVESIYNFPDQKGHVARYQVVARVVAVSYD